MVPILIHEFSTTACDPQPEKILERGRLYKVRLPPDQLNPEGYYDGTLKKAFLARFSRKKKSGRADLRAPTKKMRLPEPGEGLLCCAVLCRAMLCLLKASHAAVMCFAVLCCVVSCCAVSVHLDQCSYPFQSVRSTHSPGQSCLDTDPCSCPNDLT